MKRYAYLFSLCVLYLVSGKILFAQTDSLDITKGSVFQIPEGFAPYSDSVMHSSQVLKISKELYHLVDPESSLGVEEIASQEFQGRFNQYILAKAGDTIQGTVWYKIKLIGDNQPKQRYLLRMPQPFQHTRVYEIEGDSIHLLHDHNMNSPPDSIHQFSYFRCFVYTTLLEFEAGEEKELLIQGMDALAGYCPTYNKIELSPWSLYRESEKDELLLPRANQLRIFEGLAQMREMSYSMNKIFNHSNEEMYHLVDSTGELSIEDIIKEPWHKQFQPTNIHRFNSIKSNENTYWFRVRIKGTHKALQQYMLQYPNPYKEIRLYEKLADTIVLIDRTNIHPNRRLPNIRLYDEFNTTLVLESKEERTFYFQCIQPLVQPTAGLGWRRGSIHIYPLQQQFWEDQSLLNSRIPLIVFLILIIYHLILYFRLRESLYLWFVFLLGTMLFYSQDQFIGHHIRLFFPDWFPWHAMKAIGLTAGFILFARSLLNIPEHLPKWNRVLMGWFIVFTAIALMREIPGFPLPGFLRGNRYATLSMIIAPALIFIVSWIRWRQGSRPALWFFLSFGVPALLMVGSGVLNVIFKNSFSWYYFQIFQFTNQMLMVGFLAIAFSERIKDIDRERLETQRRRLLIKNELLVETERRKALESIDQARTRLYTNISHEFRTPLSVISALSEQIVEQLPGNLRITLSQPFEAIQRNSYQLLRLVNQLLDLAKLEAQALKPQMIQGNVIVYLRYLVESFHSFAESKGVELSMDTSLSALHMDYDPDRLRDIVSNLISNALKFTEAGGKVSVQFSEVSRQLVVDNNREENSTTSTQLSTANCLLLTVSDTGKGIPEAQLPYIFDRFYQVEENSANPSTGIGLALTQELVNLFNGKIEVESEEGVGSTFKVCLPITQKAPIGGEEYPGDLVSEMGLAPAPTISEATPPNEKPIVLLIEDNKDVIQYMQGYLQHTYQLVIAENGAEGIEKAFQTIPDLIISDVMMPQKDGYEVTKILKEDEKTSHIPIILLTAKASMEDKLSGLRRGADAYLTKPFHKEELSTRIEQLLQLRQKLRERYASLSPLIPAKEVATQQEDNFLIKVNRMIETNIDGELNVPDLAKEMAMSTSQLHRKLKALTGRSTNLYIRAFRLQKAKHLLENTAVPIAEVAYSVGFSDPSYFTRAFVKEFGVRPNEVRL